MLNDDDAYDVAGYINSKERPVKADLAKDFPIKLQKPADTPYGPYVDGFDQHQHTVRPVRPDPRQDPRAAGSRRSGGKAGPASKRVSAPGEPVVFSARVAASSAPPLDGGG